MVRVFLIGAVLVSLVGCTSVTYVQGGHLKLKSGVQTEVDIRNGNTYEVLLVNDGPSPVEVRLDGEDAGDVTEFAADAGGTAVFHKPLRMSFRAQGGGTASVKCLFHANDGLYVDVKRVRASIE